MTLNTRIIVAITLTLFFLIAVFFSVESLVLLKQYNAFEERLVEKHLRQAVYLVNQRLEQLGNMTLDWSDWMETYRFTQTGDMSGYRLSGIDAIHEHLHLHFIAIADNNSKLLLNRFYSFTAGTGIPIRELSSEYLLNAGELLRYRDPSIPRKGLYSTEIGPMLLTSYPVTDTAGNIGGRLLFGKLIDYETERQLFAESPFRVDLIQLSAQPMAKDIAAAFPKLSLQRPYYSTNINSDITLGYALLPDISGSPAFILKVTNSHEYFQLKRAALFQLVIFTVIAVIGITASVLYVLRRTVLRRIDRLESSVNALSGDFTAPVSLAIGGSDELTKLAFNIERLVLSLRNSNARLRESEWYLKSLTQATQILLPYSDRLPFAEFIAILGNAANADRAYLAISDPRTTSELKLQIAANWFADEDPVKSSVAGDYVSIAELGLESWFAEIITGKIVNTLIDDLPAEQRELFQRRNVKSQLALPLLADQNFFGLLYFARTKTHRIWDESEIDYLKFAAVALSQSLRRKQIENDLSVQTGLLTQLLANSPEGIVFLDPDFIVKSINSTFSQMFGYSSFEAIGKSVEELIVPAEGIESAEMLHYETTCKRIAETDTVRRRKDGSLIDVSIIGIPIVVDDILIGVYGVYRDITERKRNERALIASKKRIDIMYRLTEGVSRGLSLEEICQLAFDEIEKEIKPAGQIIRLLKYNSELTATFNRGMSSDYIALTSSLHSGEFGDWFAKKYRLVNSDRLTDSTIGSALRSEGVESFAVYAMISGEKLIGSYSILFKEFHHFASDEVQLCESIADTLSIVLQHHNSEIERRSSEERLRSLFQSAHDGYIMFDENGIILDVNPSATRIIGYPSKDLIGKPAKHFLPIAFAVDYDSFVKKATGAGIHGVITECVMANGVAIPVEASASLASLAAGSGVFVVLRDITERVQSERLQKTLLDIAHATTGQYGLEEMLANIHRCLSMVVYAENFYVALYDQDTGLYSFPYQTDRYDPPILEPIRLDNSLTDYVRRTKKPVLLDPSNHDAWKEIDEIQSHGTSSFSWLGIPLISRQHVVGAAVVQSYDEEFAYTPRDLAIMQLIAGQIAAAIERKQAEASLRESETRYRQIFSMTVAVKLLYDPIAGNILDANPAACKFYGYSLRELKSKSISDLELSSMKVLDAPSSSNQKFSDHYRIALHKLKSGELRTVELYSGPITLHEKEYVHSIVHDISSRIRTETENRRLAKLVESTAESITITDQHGTIVYVNPAFSQLTGYTYEETIGKNPSFLQSGKHDQEHYRNLWETILSGSNWIGKLIDKKKDGSFYQSEAIIIPLKNDLDEITSFAKIERDVTSELEMQERLLQAQRMASIGQLTGGIAHNFNNLLTGILGNLELIRMAGAPSTIPLVLEAEKASHRAADLVRQLMAFSRKSQIRRKAVDVYSLLQEVTGMLRNTVDRRIDISLTGDFDHVALGDANQLHQVFLNICMNAVDALKVVSTHDSRPLRLELCSQLVQLNEFDERLDADAKPGKYCCIAISDSGSGMTSETMKKIFEPFFTTKDVGKGTGLGLATAYGIIRQHEGWIIVESELGIGTTFRIYLPTPAVPKLASNDSTNKEPVLVGGTETILIVDDEEMLRMLGKTILERNGYTVQLAVNGMEAFEILQRDSNRIDAVLLDLSMPVMSGRELLDRLPELPATPKIVISTGFSEQIARDDPIIQQYRIVSKPYRISELLQAVRKALDENKTG